MPGAGKHSVGIFMFTVPGFGLEAQGETCQQLMVFKGIDGGRWNRAEKSVRVLQPGKMSLLICGPE